MTQEEEYIQKSDEYTYGTTLSYHSIKNNLKGMSVMIEKDPHKLKDFLYCPFKCKNYKPTNEIKKELKGKFANAKHEKDMYEALILKNTLEVSLDELTRCIKNNEITCEDKLDSIKTFFVYLSQNLYKINKDLKTIESHSIIFNEYAYKYLDEKYKRKSKEKENTK